MRAAAWFVILGVWLVPSLAWPCGNAVHLEGDDAIKYLAKIEKLIDAGKYRQARAAMYHEVEYGDSASSRLAARDKDYRALLAIRDPRSKQRPTWTVKHFKARAATKAGQKDVRLRAWLAEAYAATGYPELAREILLELRERDLMPDAFAYVTLAAVTTGEARAAALTACKTRTKHEAICQLSAPKESRARTVRPVRMRL
jgi:hypothetical protein